MLNFIIYEDYKKMRDLYDEVIHQFIGKKKETSPDGSTSWQPMCPAQAKG